MSNHEQIGISEAEYDALRTVRNMLCSGEIVHSPKGAKHAGFNMLFYDDHRSCGTAHCIGGFAIPLAPALKISRHEHRGVHDLFNPQEVNDWENISCAQAVRALDNFLFITPGNPNWTAAIKGEDT